MAPRLRVKSVVHRTRAWTYVCFELFVLVEQLFFARISTSSCTNLIFRRKTTIRLSAVSQQTDQAQLLLLMAPPRQMELPADGSISLTRPPVQVSSRHLRLRHHCKNSIISRNMPAPRPVNFTVPRTGPHFGFTSNFAASGAGGLDPDRKDHI